MNEETNQEFAQSDQNDPKETEAANQEANPLEGVAFLRRVPSVKTCTKIGDYTEKSGYKFGEGALVNGRYYMAAPFQMTDESLPEMAVWAFVAVLDYWVRVA